MSKQKQGNPNCKVSWFAMPSIIAQSNEIGGRDFKVLTLLLERENLFLSTRGKANFYCYEDWIAETTGLSIPSVKRSIKWLSEQQFITITKGRRENQYTINWDFINQYEAPKKPVVIIPTTTRTLTASTPHDWMTCVSREELNRLLECANSGDKPKMRELRDRILQAIQQKYPDACDERLKQELLIPAYNKKYYGDRMVDGQISANTTR